MRAAPVLLVGLLHTAPAAAGPLDDTRQGALHDEVAPEVAFAAVPLTVRWRLDATAAQLVTADRDVRSTVSLGAEVAVSHRACDILVAGGQLDGSSGDGAPLAAQQWASVCPISGALRFELGHLLQWDVTPSLLAAPRRRPEASRSETITVGLRGRTDPLNDPGPLTLLPLPAPEYVTFGDTTMAVTMSWTAEDSSSVDGAIRADCAFVGFRRERADDGEPLVVSVIATTMESNMAAGEGPFTMMARLDAFRISGARWRGLRWGASLGFGVVSVMSTTMTPAPADPEAPVEETSVWAGEGGLAVEREVGGGATVRLAGDRVHWGLWDGRAVIDDRVSLGVSRGGGRLRLRSEVFAAHSHVIALDGITTGSTGGVTAIAETDLGRHASLRVRSDAGRGFYAEGASFDRPRWAAEVLATVALRLGRAGH